MSRVPTVAGLTIGAVLRNLGGGIRFGDGETSDPMPVRLRMGAAFDVTGTFIPDEERFGIVVQLDVQETVSEFDDLDVFAGAELSLRRILFVRGGYAWATAGRTGPSLGLGLRYDRLAVDVGHAFDDFARYDSGTPFQISLWFRI